MKPLRWLGVAAILCALAAPMTAWARVVPNGEGAEFVFTQMQQAGTPDDVFAQLVAAVGHELTVLKAVLEVACPR